MDSKQQEALLTPQQTVFNVCPEYRVWEILMRVLKEHEISTRRFAWHLICTPKSTGKQITYLRKISALCSENDFDIYDFLSTMLSFFDDTYALVKIKDFLDETFIDKYKSERNDSRFKERYLWQCHYCKITAPSVIPSIYATESDFLLDPHQPFDSWFRVLHPNRLDTRIFDMYGNEANKEILHNGALYKFLKTLDGTIIDLSRIVGKTYG